MLFASAPHKGLREVYTRFARLRQWRPSLRLEVADPGYLRWDAGPTPDGARPLGQLSHARLTARMAGALCLFHAQRSFAETFGLVIAEANAVGTPALVQRGLGANDEVASTAEQCVDVDDIEAVLARLDDWRREPPVVTVRPGFRLSAVAACWRARLAAGA